MFTEEYRCKSEPEDLFAMTDIYEFGELISKFKIKHIHTVGTDGVAPFFEEVFKNISDSEYEEWLKYHFITCERPDLIGYSNHVLYIGRKE